MITRKESFPLFNDTSQTLGTSKISSAYGTISSRIPDPYEDPDLQPGFVRSTKEYLKQSNLLNV